MARAYTAATTEVHWYLSNDSMNNSIHDNSNMTSPQFNCDRLHFFLFTVVGGPMCVLGFIANILCYKVLKTDSGKKHGAATFLLQALAVADNLVLTLSFFNLSIIVGLLPMVGAEGKNISDMLFVYVHVYIIPLVTMAMAATVWITVLIAVNRYIAVCRPLDAPRLASLKVTKVQVVVVFTLAIIFSLPYFLQYSIVYLQDSDLGTIPTLTQTSFGPSTLLGMVYKSIFDRAALMIIPLILLTFFNTRIIWDLRKADKSKDTIRQSGSKSENNITIVMIVIIIVFIVCNIPGHIYEIAYYFIPALFSSCSVLYAIWCVSVILLAANSATNFVVYYVLRKSFRRAFRKALCCGQPQAMAV